MTVLAKTKPSELHAGYVLAHVVDIDEREHPQHAHWLRTAILLAGVALVGAGLVLGLAVAWNQLARALPLAALLHRPRALRAGVLIVLGLGLGLLGRAGRRPRRRGARLTRAGSIAIATVIILAAGTAPALALDATGTWSGQSICRQRAGKNVTATERRSSTMMISQRAGALFVEIDGTPYRGRSRPSGHGATRARSAVSYADDGERPSDTSAVVRLRIHIDESRGMSRLVAESSLHDASGRRHCRYRFERTRREDPGMAPSPPPRGAFCGDGVVDRALNEECDGDATGTPCDGACTAACSCSQRCEPLSVTGHWEGTYLSEVTGETGTAVADLSDAGIFIFGTISFPPFRYAIYSGPLVVMGACSPATFSSGAMLASGSFGILDGVATNASMAGSWRISDGSDHGTWQLAR
jgi:hypothetical protein